MKMIRSFDVCKGHSLLISCISDFDYMTVVLSCKITSATYLNQPQATVGFAPTGQRRLPKILPSRLQGYREAPSTHCSLTYNIPVLLLPYIKRGIALYMPSASVPTISHHFD